MTERVRPVKVHPVTGDSQRQELNNVREDANFQTEQRILPSVSNRYITIEQQPIYGPQRVPLALNPNYNNYHQQEYPQQDHFDKNSPTSVALAVAPLLASTNPLAAALFLSASIGLPPHGVHPPLGYNHPQHLPVNPYLSLLLSHYGRYLSVPPHITGREIYGYSAANNIHNNRPFGAYKIAFDKE